MKKIFISCMIGMFLTQGIAGAAALDRIKYDTTSETLTVTGTSDIKPDSDMQAVTIRVLKPGISAEKFGTLTDAEKKNSVVYVRQVETGKSGEFSFAYMPENYAYGNYNIYVTDAVGNVFYNYKLFIDSEESANVLNAVNTANPAEMKRALENYAYLLDGVPAFEELKIKYTDVDFIDTISAMITGIAFSVPDDVVDEAVKASIVTAINNAADKDELKDILDKYKTYIGFDTNTIYTKLFLDAADKLAGNFIGQNYDSTKAFIQNFSDTVILKRLAGINNYAGVSEILDNSRFYLSECKFDKYDKLTENQKAYVQKKVADNAQGIDTIATLSRVFNDAVSNAPAENTSTPTGGGNSGGSGNSGNSGGSGFVTPGGIPAVSREIFSDLSGYEWAKDSIVDLYKKGIVSGMGEDKFEPSGLVTREQFAKMLVTACGMYNPEDECNFGDVDKQAWYGSYVASAVKHGIVFGESEQIFGTGKNVTRQDMAAMVCRAAAIKGADTRAELPTAFEDDNDISEYAKEAVYFLKNAGVMSGKGNNCFAPKEYATRAEAAKLIYGLISMEEFK